MLRKDQRDEGILLTMSGFIYTVRILILNSKKSSFISMPDPSEGLPLVFPWFFLISLKSLLRNHRQRNNTA